MSRDILCGAEQRRQCSVVSAERQSETHFLTTRPPSIRFQYIDKFLPQDFTVGKLHEGIRPVNPSPLHS
ncbi:hypothetical protein GN956_G22289 [Arapaima gigas]